MAVNSEAQNSTSLMEGGDIQDPTPLQKHVMFFDINGDGVLYPSESYKGFRRLGVGILLSTFAPLVIHIAFSRRTRPGKGFSFSFPIEIKNIHRAKHGSDTDVFDEEGRFVPSKFEEIFENHAHKNKNALTSDELNNMVKANRDPKDYKGWFAAYTEWRLLYHIAKDEQGLFQKETIRSFYDGSLLDQIAKKNASRKQGRR